MTTRPAVLGYAPGASWLHRASPLPKLAWLLAALPVVLLTYDPAVLAVMIGAGGVLAVSGRVGRIAARTLVALAPIAAGIVVLQALAPVACPGATCTPAASLGPLILYAEGIGFSLVLAGRLVALELVAVAMLATTHPSDLFAALRSLRLPYEIALMAMLSMQLVPQLGQELQDVLAAQRARGMRGSGLRALVPTLVPVVAAAFDRLTLLVLSLESRGVGAGPRTSFRRVHLGAVGAALLVLAAPAALAGTWLAASQWGPARASSLVVPGPVAVGLVLGAALAFVSVMVAGLRGLAER